MFDEPCRSRPSDLPRTHSPSSSARWGDDDTNRACPHPGSSRRCDVADNQSHRRPWLTHIIIVSVSGWIQFSKLCIQCVQARISLLQRFVRVGRSLFSYSARLLIMDEISYPCVSFYDVITSTSVTSSGGMMLACENAKPKIEICARIRKKAFELKYTPCLNVMGDLVALVDATEQRCDRSLRDPPTAHLVLLCMYFV